MQVFFTIVSNTKVAKSFWAGCGFGKPKLDRMCDYISDGTFCFKNSFVWAYNNKVGNIKHNSIAQHMHT